MRFLPYALPPAAFEARRAQLTWRFRKWDTHVKGRETVARGAIVLTAREHRDLVIASEALFALTQDALAALPGDEQATREVGVDAALTPLALAAAPTRARVTRIDWFLTAGGWRASEWNDDAPGGYNDALGLVALFADCVEKGLDVPGELPEALLRVLAPPCTERVGLVYATAYSEDLQVVRLLADLLEANGTPTVLGSPAHLEHGQGRTTLAGERIDSVFRFFPAEWFPALASAHLDAWREAIAAGLRVVNPLACAWTQSKASFALPRIARDPRAAGVLPRTEVLNAANAPAALEERADRVLKPAFGRMGEGVVLGGEVPQDAWRKAIAGALRSAMPYVLQKRFYPLPLELAPGITATPCIGAYVVEGRFAGYYSRIARGSVVRHDASNLLTLLEAV